MINQTTSKVVDLIVPRFKSKAAFGILILFFGFNSSLLADVPIYGCWIPDPNPNLNRIWFVLDPSRPGFNFINDLNGNGVDDNYRQLQNRCGNSMAVQCTVYQKNGDIRGYGYLADYSVEYCPLDDYVVLLYLISGLFAMRVVVGKNQNQGCISA